MIIFEREEFHLNFYPVKFIILHKKDDEQFIVRLLLNIIIL